MPKKDGELSDEELEQVVGGSKDMKHLFGHWRGYIKEGVDLKVGTFFEHPHQNLNKSLWDENDQLKPEVGEKLLEIAQRFISKTQGADAEIKDITFTGSLANYNYSMLSDIDLHILIDFDELNGDVGLVKDYFNAVKALWNYLHDIRIKGYEVEVYVQDAGLVGPPESEERREEHISSGVYSIMKNEWLRKPEHKKAEIDNESITKKADSLMDQIDRALEVMEKGKHREAHERAIKIRKKIKKMRQAGLESGGEYSSENLAFKTLRNNGYLGKLSHLKRDAYDKMMSLNEEDQGWFSKIKSVIKKVPIGAPSGPGGLGDMAAMASGRSTPGTSVVRTVAEPFGVGYGKTGISSGGHVSPMAPAASSFSQVTALPPGTGAPLPSRPAPPTSSPAIAEVPTPSTPEIDQMGPPKTRGVGIYAPAESSSEISQADFTDAMPEEPDVDLGSSVRAESKEEKNKNFRVKISIKRKK